MKGVSQVPCAEGGVQGDGDGRGIPGPMSGGCTIPCGLFHNACDFTYPPCEQTHDCENITFKQLLLRAVIIVSIWLRSPNTR